MNTNRTNTLRTIFLFLMIGIVPLGLGTGSAQSNLPVEGSSPSFSSEPDPEFIPPLNDPIEPVNRSFGYLNHGIMMGIIDPTSRIYRFVIPRPVRKCVNNAGENLAFPVRFVNNIFQAQFMESWEETKRFGVNTTVGILGLFDPATQWGIGSYREDTGLTFGRWGWSNQIYVMLPFLGPSSERDALGRVGDTLLNPATYLFPASPIFIYNRLSDDIIPYKQLTSSEYDPYDLSRDLYALSREEKIENLDLSASLRQRQQEEEAAIQTLGAVLLEPKDPGFFIKQKKRKVVIPSTGAKLPYSLWIQKGQSRVAYILPGLGGHRSSVMSCALAEMFYLAGYTTVTLSSAMNWEFIQTGLTSLVPGYAPADGRDVLECLEMIHRDLVGRYPERITGRILVGASLGAFHTLLIADAEKSGSAAGIQFDRYLAINPPVDLLYGVQQLDTFYRAPLEIPIAERELWMDAALQKAVELASLGKSNKGGTNAIPTTVPDTFHFNGTEARFLIGLQFRHCLRDVIHASQRKNDMGILQTRLGLMNRDETYAEIMGYSFKKYLQVFVIPAVRQKTGRTVTLADIQHSCDLKERTQGLANHPKVRIFTNHNDFLLREEDRQWLNDRFTTGKLQVHQGGGHMGNLNQTEVQGEILALIR